MRTTLVAGLAAAALALALACQPQMRDDAAITRDVTQDLRSDPQLASAPVEVRTDQGHVTLLGSVATDDARSRAEDLAEDVDGVASVSNRIAVLPPGAGTMPDVAAPPPEADEL